MFLLHIWIEHCFKRRTSCRQYYFVSLNLFFIAIDDKTNIASGFANKNIFVISAQTLVAYVGFCWGRVRKWGSDGPFFVLHDDAYSNWFDLQNFLPAMLKRGNIKPSKKEAQNDTFDPRKSCKFSFIGNESIISFRRLFHCEKQ